MKQLFYAILFCSTYQINGMQLVARQAANKTFLNNKGNAKINSRLYSETGS